MWRNKDRRKLLLLDLDGTLVNCNRVSGAGQDSFQVKDIWYHVDRRPFLNDFLDYAAKHFDLAVFTASQQEYAEEVIKILQLSLPLFSRSACARTDRGFIKNLKREFQDLSQVVLLDDSPESYLEQPRNVIRISTWKSGADSELLRCIPILKRVQTSFNVHEVDLNKW